MAVRLCSNSLKLQQMIAISRQTYLLDFNYRLSHLSLNRKNEQFSCLVEQSGRGARASVAKNYSVSTSSASRLPVSGLDDVLMGYLFGKKKATEVAHSVWKHVVQKGDTVVDATCGNGFDTLAMLEMVKDDSGGGSIYGMDIQEDAIKSTSFLLDSSLNAIERKKIKLFVKCHSRMLEVLPTGSSVRLVAFNLGYLPRGDKGIITKSNTTLLALEAAKEVLLVGGLISLLVYVGHPGGREEYDAVCAFTSALPTDEWCCSQIKMPNRPLAPVLVLLFRR